ncbi:hypothetical protein KC318_g4374 [Hortaea werneckii]|nr:hypothetical protein KC334_g4590 [Hortaea werneckii]KAI7014786.1 hypothetical protein KC355_g4562 [Hortaea werneckii]KAI7669864.1 hypothetical protein KC318_g4374 [Hortaea werneckii]
MATTAESPDPPIPTAEGIVLLDGGKSCQVTRFNDIVKKSGSRVRREEGNALIFARDIGLPAPGVHDISDAEKGHTITMEYIDANCLEDAWPNLSSEQRISIARDLRALVTKMRQYSYDSISGCDGPLHLCRTYTSSIGGPFQNESAFNEFAYDYVGTIPRDIRKCFAARLPTDSRFVFTHGDLSPRNIFIKEDRLHAIIDMEYSGWYPEYWEYVKFFECVTGCKGWKDLADVIFETTYPTQLLFTQASLRWQKP